MALAAHGVPQLTGDTYTASEGAVVVHQNSVPQYENWKAWLDSQSVDADRFRQESGLHQYQGSLVACPWRTRRG